MIKALLLGTLLCASTSIAHAQTRATEISPKDLISGGDFPGQTNSWILTTPDNGSTEAYLMPFTNGNWDYSALTRFASNGDVQHTGALRVGLKYPYSMQNFKLAVDGNIVCQGLYVTNPSTWADFVFEPSYKPMALPELESYLRKNKHLPYIPSAKQVETNGYSVTEMDAKLLQTVEELTLQVIELSKKVERLETEKGSNVRK